MRANGNGQPDVCAYNLIRTFRGEVPYSRVKGIDARNIDRPANLVRAAIEEDAEWVIDTYEPRVDASGAVSSVLDAIHGDFALAETVTEVST